MAPTCVSVFKESGVVDPGILIQQSDNGYGIIIKEIEESGLFSTSGLCPGMELISINNIKCSILSIYQVEDILREVEGIVSIVADNSSTLPNTPVVEATCTMTSLEARTFNDNEKIYSRLLLEDEDEDHSTPIEAVVVIHSSNETSHPPPGVEDGGTWGKNPYIGNKTKFVTCLGCLCFGLLALCVLFCPQDERDVYCVDDKLYNASGKYLGEIDDLHFVPERRPKTLIVGEIL
mmetsp:Transcript_25070/g.29015  ORF Transcript_25070/g.29015 Transcript_25070/m.29015 type:complete len:234 (+) Transcript_25070:78-779(+)